MQTPPESALGQAVRLTKLGGLIRVLLLQLLPVHLTELFQCLFRVHQFTVVLEVGLVGLHLAGVFLLLCAALVSQILGFGGVVLLP